MEDATSALMGKLHREVGRCIRKNLKCSRKIQLRYLFRRNMVVVELTVVLRVRSKEHDSNWRESVFNLFRRARTSPSAPSFTPSSSVTSTGGLPSSPHPPRPSPASSLPSSLHLHTCCHRLLSSPPPSSLPSAPLLPPLLSPPPSDPPLATLPPRPAQRGAPSYKY